MMRMKSDLGKSGRGLPQSKSWRTVQRIGASRSVVECGSPLPLLDFAHWQELAHFVEEMGKHFV